MREKVTYRKIKRQRHRDKERGTHRRQIDNWNEWDRELSKNRATCRRMT